MAGLVPTGYPGAYRRELHALHEYENFYNAHRPHQGIANARSLAPLPEPFTDIDQPDQPRT